VGRTSLYSNTTASNITAVGFRSMYQNTTGSANTATGSHSLYSNTTGYNNTATGNYALYANTIGANNTSNGNYTLHDNTEGSGNTAVGISALSGNTTGQYNTALGYNAFSSGTSIHNSMALGNSSSITASNQVRLGNASITSIGGYAAWSNLSDIRFKKDVRDDIPGLNFIIKLRPISYHMDMDALAGFLGTPDSLRSFTSEAIKGKMLQTGFIAQEVEEAARSIGYDFSGVDAPKNENDFYALRYAEFVVPLVKAVQEQQVLIEEQYKMIVELQNVNTLLLLRVEKLEEK
jgi:hypothetical protein